MVSHDRHTLRKMSEDAAQALAVDALTYLSSQPELMQRFLALSGIDASRIRLAAKEPHFLAGILKFFLAHEPTLLAFSAATNTPPQQVGAALAALPGGLDYSE